MVLSLMFRSPYKEGFHSAATSSVRSLSPGSELNHAASTYVTPSFHGIMAS